jgi:hypothetical protein
MNTNEDTISPQIQEVIIIIILSILTVNSFSVGVGRVGAPVVDVASQLTMLSVGFPFGLAGGVDVEVTGCVFLGLPLPPFGDFVFLERGLSVSESSEPSSSSSSSLVLGSARRGFFVAVEFLKRRDCRLPVPYPMAMKIHFTYKFHIRL